jgi:hypothetical protein
VLSDAEVVQMRAGFAAGRYAVPDIVAYVPGSTGEFYEIKPNSTEGIRQGDDKIRDVLRLMSEFRLVYLPGTRYNPDQLQPFESRLVNGMWIWEIELHFWREKDALILYEFCHKGRDRRERVEVPQPDMQLYLALAAVLILLILTDGAAAPILIAA